MGLEAELSGLLASAAPIKIRTPSGKKTLGKDF
jgi:hypothetical protein